MDRISAVFCSHFLVLEANSLPYDSFISYIQHQFLAIHSTLPDSCVNTIGDTILMQVKPWFSSEVGKDFRKRENGGEMYYCDIGKNARIICFLFRKFNRQSTFPSTSQDLLGAHFR